jgi:hypothetical protein
LFLFSYKRMIFNGLLASIIIWLKNNLYLHAESLFARLKNGSYYSFPPAGLAASNVCSEHISYMHGGILMKHHRNFHHWEAVSRTWTRSKVKVTLRGQSSDENVYSNHIVLIYWGIETQMVITMTTGVKNVIPSLVVHIVSIFRFNDFCPSYGPLIFFIFKVCLDYFSYTTNAISMKLYSLSGLLLIYRYETLQDWFVRQAAHITRVFGLNDF